jgi:RNA polymerase sigma-70 factor (ECF subfamily)
VPPPAPSKPPSPAGDDVHRLLQRIGAGDLLAVHLFYRRVEPFLRGLARKWLSVRLRRSLDSDDVVQSAMRRMVDSSTRARFEDEARALAWAATIVRNRIRAEARKERTRHGDAGPVAADAATVEGPAPSPLESASNAEEIQALHVAMAALPDAEREAIVLHDFNDLEFAEVARVLSRPSADAARKLHARGLSRLRKRLARRAS